MVPPGLQPAGHTPGLSAAGATVSGVHDGTPAIRLTEWTQADLSLLREANTPRMTAHLGGPETEDKLLSRHLRYLCRDDPAASHPASNTICRKAGFTFCGETDFEYPPGTIMRCNDWRLEL